MKKLNPLIIVGGIILLIIFMNGGKKEAAIPDFVNAGSSVSVMGEMVVKETATAWVPGPADKVHWFICKESGCSTVVDSGFTTLSSTQKNDLNDRLTDPLGKTTIYYTTFTAPMQEGYYYYKGQAETASGLIVVSINIDSYVMFGNSNRFYVKGSGVPCSDYTDEEIKSIDHGAIRITVYHHMTGTEPSCTESSKEEIGYVTVCDEGYIAKGSGKTATCELPPPPETTTTTIPTEGGDGGAGTGDDGDGTEEEGKCNSNDDCLSGIMECKNHKCVLQGWVLIVGIAFIGLIALKSIGSMGKQ